jgi:hypothetical protein
MLLAGWIRLNFRYERYCSLCRYVFDGSEAHYTAPSVSNGDHFHWGKETKGETKKTRPNCAEFKNSWRSISTHTCVVKALLLLKNRRRLPVVGISQRRVEFNAT